MGKRRLILIGNGMAGVRTIEEIVKHAGDAYQIAVIGREPHPNYNRMLLSSVLQGDASLKDITLNSRTWYEEHGIALYTGETAVKIDTDRRTVSTDKNREIAYDKLIIATGSSPFILPVPGADKEGVYGFRTIEDCRAFIDAAGRYRKAAVIGGGILGLEAAKGLVNLGMEVSVIHHSSYIMQNQLDRTASAMLQHDLERQGIHFLLEKDTEAVLGTSRATGLRFKDGTEVEADLIVMAAGVRPNIGLAKASGLAANRAIIVNGYMETNVPDVYAVGECAEHNGVVYGLIKPLYEQGQVLARHICGLECEPYRGAVQSATLKIAGIDLFSAGKIKDDDTTTAIRLIDESAGIYKKAVFQADQMAGVILYGDTKNKQKLLESIVKQRDITVVKKTFFQSGGESTVSSMLLDETICQCHAVSKGAIIEAVKLHDLKTAEDVKRCTKASGSCGGCRPLIEELLIHAAEHEYEKPAGAQAMCSCTSLTEDEVVEQIQMRQLSSVQDVISQLGWKTGSGCSVCAPAIHYYLRMIRPGVTAAEPLLHEDGGCTIVPQTYGGLIKADELRRIADAIEKYGIPHAVLTPGQRLKIPGIGQSVKENLQMPICAVHKHTVGPIKTCACTNLDCVQAIAVELEKETETLIMPARTSIAISACTDDCVYCTVHDIGVLKAGRGWELYAGGRGGQNARAGELFSVAETLKKAGEYIKGFLQYYRETANYLEGVGQWINRAGIIHIREVLFDNDLRGQLLERLEKEQRLLVKETIKGLM